MQRSLTKDEWEARIDIDPGIQGGRPVIKGTRVPLYVLIGGLAGGDSIEEICESYRVTPDDVRAALAYAAEIIYEERVYAVPR